MCKTCEINHKKTFAEIIKEFGMNEEQVEYCKQYSLQRSCRAYEKIAASKLSDDENMQDWKYAGMYDAGYRGAEYCSAGHPLRYVHIAKNVKTGQEIQFGIVCVQDFFKITKAQLKYLKQGFNLVQGEIQQIIDKFVKYEGNFDAYENLYHYKEKFEFIMKYDSSSLYLDSDKVDQLLKIGHIRMLFQMKLPLPDYFENAIHRCYSRVEYQVRIKHQANINSLVQNKLENTQQVNVSTQVNPNQAVFDYLQVHHPQAYSIASSLYSASLKYTPTDKQKALFNKLISTPWQEIDTIVLKVHNKELTVNTKLNGAFLNMTNTYRSYGLSEKQITLFKKAVGL